LRREHKQRDDVSENPEHRLVHEGVRIFSIDDVENILNEQDQQVQAEPGRVIDDELMGFQNSSVLF